MQHRYQQYRGSVYQLSIQPTVKVGMQQLHKPKWLPIEALSIQPTVKVGMQRLTRLLRVAPEPPFNSAHCESGNATAPQHVDDKSPRALHLLKKHANRQTVAEAFRFAKMPIP